MSTPNDTFGLKAELSALLDEYIAENPNVLERYAEVAEAAPSASAATPTGQAPSGEESGYGSKAGGMAGGAAGKAAGTAAGNAVVPVVGGYVGGVIGDKVGSEVGSEVGGEVECELEGTAVGDGLSDATEWLPGIGGSEPSSGEAPEEEESGIGGLF